MVEASHTGNWWSFPPLRNSVLAGIVAGATFLLERLGLLTHGLAIAGYVAAIPLGGWHWIREGVEKLITQRVVGIEILMIFATFGAATLGLWDEAAALVVLYGVAEGIEEYAFARTRSSIRSLLDLAPKEARLLKDGIEQTVLADQLQLGDVFVVRPGEGIVTDGVVVSGQSALNQAAVTGESMPVEKGPGMQVFAGSINGEGALTIKASAAFADNTLSRIIHLVEEAQEQKGRAQQWIDRFGRRYSPAVLIAAALLLFAPMLLGLPFDVWAQRAVVLLVAAAPCALIMSMPMAMASGIGSAGRHGILIKGGAHLEHLGRIGIVAFDKTGTLTIGKPEVTEIVPGSLGADELLQKAASVEHFSQHPVAHAIVQAATKRGLKRDSSDQFQSITGGGASATVLGVDWLLGSPALMRKQGISLDSFDEKIAALQSNGNTVVAIASAGVAMGVIAVRDQLRPEAAGVVAELRRRGLRTVMLTGDNALTGKAVASLLGIEDVRAELRPEDKVSAIRELAIQRPVLMVGDGVNDAPALAAATCGVAMGAAGADSAIEAADVALMTDDLTKLTTALDFGQKARLVSRQNIVLSLAVLAAMIPLAVAGVIGVATAVLVHEAAELLAVGNGLRAGRVKRATLIKTRS
jgi:heavy metal translocating P-type ATPase